MSTVAKSLVVAAAGLTFSQGDIFVAVAAFVGGLLGCGFTPEPRTFFKYLNYGLVALFVGYLFARASRTELDHMMLLGFVFGIFSTPALDFLMNKAWKERTKTVYIQNNQNSGQQVGQNEGEVKQDDR